MTEMANIASETGEDNFAPGASILAELGSAGECSNGEPHSSMTEDIVVEERAGLLRQTSRRMAGLALRTVSCIAEGLVEAGSGIKQSVANLANKANYGKSECGEDKENLDEKTLKRIKEIQDGWTFDVYNGGFVLKNGEQALETAVDDGYEGMEKLIPNIRYVAAEDERFNPDSEKFDKEYTLDHIYAMAADSVKDFFGRYHAYMPELTSGAIDSIQNHLSKMSHHRAEKHNYYKQLRVLLLVEKDLPKELRKRFDAAIFDECVGVVSEGAYRDYELSRLCESLHERGFPPGRWMRDVKKKDFPETLRKIIDEGKEEVLDTLAIYDILTGTQPRKGSIDIGKRCSLLEKYYRKRLPKIDPDILADVSEQMVMAMSDKSICFQAMYFSRYVKNICEIGQNNARKLSKELGIMHYSDWSPEVLRGTLKILETGRVESDDPATIIIMGASGDHNCAARTFYDIKSSNVFAVEIDNTGCLSAIVKKLKKVGAADKFDTVILFGHGDEEFFTMSDTEEILPDPEEWYNKKGLRELITALGIDNIILDSCHPFVREEDKFEPLAVGEGLQRRKGTASALSIAFSGVKVFSGLDGEVCFHVTSNDQDDDFSVRIITKDDTGSDEGTSKIAVTQYGLTRRYDERLDK